MSGVNAIKFATDCRILKDMDRCPTAAMARVTGCGFPSTRAAVQPISAAHPSPPMYPVTVCKELTSVFATVGGSAQKPEEISARGMAPAVEAKADGRRSGEEPAVLSGMGWAAHIPIIAGTT